MVELHSWQLLFQVAAIAAFYGGLLVLEIP